jgi:Pvc16 N-terminal domain
MISHALTIVLNELEHHFDSVYATGASTQVELGNIGEGFTGGGNNGGVNRDMLVISIVNIKEEKTLKNVPNYVRDDISLKASYENPPVFANFLILVTATHTNYTNALLVLSRTLRFFQSKNVFTQDNVLPASINTDAPNNVLDQLETFKLIFDLYSPNIEEVNHLWGTLGGKQYPFALYMMRMLDLKFKAVQSESGLITEIVNEFSHKKAK